MHKSLLTILLNLTLSLAMAQSGSIRGLVTDSKSEPVGFASVYVLKSEDSSNVAAAVTNETGQFMTDRLPFGNYLVRIKSIGFQDKWLRARLSAERTDADLGTIAMVEKGKDLKEVEIGAERKMLENSIDKKTYNVDKNILNQSGSAVDALQQLPNVTVDENGNLQLRGSEGILILINGKQTGVKGANLQTILNQIPASSIERIEVITNPSSKYDAEGSNGIINIILKRTKKGGVTGNVSGQAGTRDKYNLNGGISYNKGKLGLGATYGLRYTTMNWNGHLYRTLRPDDTLYYFNTENNGFNRTLSHAVSLSGDYYFDKFNTLSVGATGTFGRSHNPEWIRYSENDNRDKPSSKFARHNNIHARNSFQNVNLQYKKTFKVPDKEWTVSGNYTQNSDTNTLNGANQYELLNFYPSDSVFDIRQNRSKSGSNNMMVQSDFTQPLKKGRKLEAGIKSAIRNFDNEMRINRVNPVSEQWFLDSSLSNRFMYSEWINAAYVNFAGTYKTIGYQAGGRLEQTIADGTLKYNGQKVGYDRIDFFPGFYLVRKFKKVHEWKINYTRRIERPSAGQLNPFQDLSDPRNIRRGNPDLKPQFINSYELEYTFSNKKVMTNPGLYYKQTNNLMWRYVTVNEGVNYVSFENIGNSYNIGLDWITTWAPYKWVNTLTSLNVYNNRMKGQLGTFTFNNSNITASFRQTVNFKYNKVLDAQMTYNYRSPFLSPQGRGITMQWLDLGATLQVLKGKGTLTMTLSDLFNTRQFGMNFDMTNIEQSFIRKMESRILYVGFNYRFGSSSGQPKPKKREQQEQRNEDMGF